MVPPQQRAPNSSPSVTGLLSEPRKALDSFLTASTWAERIPFIYQGEKLKPKIEAYYRAYEDKPIASYLPEFDFMEDSPEPGRLPYYMYYLKISGHAIEFPVIVMNTPDGPKVDWEAFVEFKDQHLATFVQKRELGPKSFRVLLTREGYWGSDREAFTTLNDFLCYSVESPDNETKVNVFIHRNAALAKEFEAAASWGLPALAAIVELELKRFPHGADHLVINKLITDGWTLPEKQ